MRTTLFSLVAATLLACSGSDTAVVDADCDPGSDLDSDGLSACDEETLGTDPELADSDGDGFSDGDEVACVSDPTDSDEACYACGWGHNDPGTLVATGSDEGDVIENLVFADQCGEEVDLWDFAGKYYVLWMTAAW